MVSSHCFAACSLCNPRRNSNASMSKRKPNLPRYELLLLWRAHHHNHLRDSCGKSSNRGTITPYADGFTAHYCAPPAIFDRSIESVHVVSIACPNRCNACGAQRNAARAERVECLHQRPWQLQRALHSRRRIFGGRARRPPQQGQGAMSIAATDPQRLLHRSANTLVLRRQCATAGRARGDRNLP